MSAASYRYRARRADGALVDGCVSAQTRAAALRLLRGTGLHPFALERSARGESWLRRSLRAGRIGDVQRAEILRGLAQQLEGGLSLPRALETIEAEHDAAGVRAALRGCSRQLRHGATLRQVLAASGAGFQDFALAALEAASAGGRLVPALRGLARHHELSGRSARQIRAALVYPAFVAGVAALALTGLLLFLLPRLGALYGDLDQELPTMTRALWDVSRFARSVPGLLTVAGVSALVVGFAAWPGARARLRALAFRLPQIGPVLHARERCLLGSTLAALLGGGVAPLRAAGLMRSAASSELYAARVERFAGALREGAPLSDALRRSSLFERADGFALGVAEQSGSFLEGLDAVLARLAAESERRTARLAKLVEPLLISILALVVATIVAAAMLPLVSIEF